MDSVIMCSGCDSPATYLSEKKYRCPKCGIVHDVHVGSVGSPKVPAADPDIRRAGKYQVAGGSIGALVDAKNAAYGNSFHEAGAVIRALYPDGIRPAQFDDALVVIRIVDKLFRIANKKDAFGESPWEDIAGYAILMSKAAPEPCREADLGDNARRQTSTDGASDFWSNDWGENS